MDVKIKSGWKNILKNEFKQDYFIQLVELLHLEQESKGVIYPPGSLIFNAFNKTDFDVNNSVEKAFSRQEIIIFG